MKRNHSGIPWFWILLLAFAAIVFISWLVYNYNMNVLLKQQ